MNWLNINVETLDSPEFKGNDPVARATWLCLFHYCAKQENGGVITGGVEWGDRKWQQIAGVTKDEVMQDCELWDIKDGDIHVWRYPIDKELEVKAKRRNGKQGGRPKKKEGKAPPAEPKPKTPKETNQQYKSRLDAEMPDCVKSLDSIHAMGEWLDYKDDKGKAHLVYKEKGFTSLMKAIETFKTPAFLMEAVYESISKGWLGITMTSAMEYKVNKIAPMESTNESYEVLGPEHYSGD